MTVTKTITISIKPAGIDYIIKNAKYTFRDILQLIHNILSQVLDFTTSDLEQWIRKKVPKRTGQLRKSLMDWLHSSAVQQGLLRVILRSDIEYAADVNEMATSQVAHKGEKGYVYYPNPFGIRGPVILWDPEAIGGFFDNLSIYAKERILINLAKSLEMYTTGHKFSQAILKKYGEVT